MRWIQGTAAVPIKGCDYWLTLCKQKDIKLEKVQSLDMTINLQQLFA